MLRAGRHLLALIDDVLDIARVEAREMSISLEAVDVGAVVTEAVALMLPDAADARLTVVQTSGPPVGFAMADRQRLRQIMLDRMSNAGKYGGRGGHVWVGWAEQRRSVRIGVRDDGPGISPHLRDRLFTPFDRLGAEATGIEGTGVGLAVTRGLPS